MLLSRSVKNYVKGISHVAGTVRRASVPIGPSRTASGHYLSIRRITLRPYQEESIQAVLSNIEKGNKRLGLSLATGAGKTVIFSQLIGRIQPKNDAATRTLILVHRRELVQQAHAHCVSAYPDLNVEIEMGSMHASGTADITIASVQSLNRGRLEKYDPAAYKLVLVDEAHHLVSQTYLNALAHFGLVPPTKTSDALAAEEQEAPDDRERRAQEFRDSATFQDAPALVGVSATFSRFDGLSLGHAIDFIVYHKDYIDLIDEKWLCDVCFTTAKSGANLSHVKSSANGDFLTGSLSTVMNTERTNRIVVETWKSKAAERKSTLVFAVDVAHVEGLMQMFQEYSIEARAVTGKTSIYERSRTVQHFREGKFPVLINCAIFTEGTDIPNIDCVLLARPTKSRNLLVQMIGRGMRLHPDKKDCHVIDMVSSLKTGIVTVPTLFGLDPTTLVEKEKASEMKGRETDYKQGINLDSASESDMTYLNEQDDARSGKITFKEYDSIFDLLSDGETHKHIRQLSRNAWIAVGRDEEGHDRYVLNGEEHAYLKITENSAREARYEVALVRKIPNPYRSQSPNASNHYVPWSRPQLIAFSKTLSDALHAADTYASNSSLFPEYLSRWHQPWRNRPASKKQIELLEKMGKGTVAIDKESITSGQCNEFVTRLKFGAKGRWNQMLNKEKQVVKSLEKREREKKMKEREAVRVGPLSQSSFQLSE